MGHDLLCCTEAHPGSGLVYYLYRYYDPNLQRWVNRDPIGERGGFNLYTFLGNLLPEALDPWGLVKLRFADSVPPFARENILAAFCYWRATHRGRILDLQYPDVEIIIADISEMPPNQRGTACSPKAKKVFLDVTHPFFIDSASKNDMKKHGEYYDGLRAAEPVDRNIGGAITLGHELGHVLTGELDEPEGGRNVRLNEDPLRIEVGLGPRKSYGGIKLP